MSLLPTDRKDQTKLAVAVLAGALGAYYYLYPYSTRAIEIADTRARVERLESTNERAMRELKRGTAKTLRAQAAQSRATLGVLRQLVPAAHEVPAVLEEVSTAARRAGLELGGVQPEPVIGGDQFDTHRYKVTVVGSYHALTAFLANVGSLPRIVAPVTFALVTAQPTGGQGSRTGAFPATVQPLMATVTLQTYVAHAAPGGASRAGEVLP
ncbi:MAG: type 4a pilus biogenesis protein PilO [Gemmatirosa sp.]